MRNNSVRLDFISKTDNSVICHKICLRPEAEALLAKLQAQYFYLRINKNSLG
jgi:hypothetical protein